MSFRKLFQVSLLTLLGACGSKNSGNSSTSSSAVELDDHDVNFDLMAHVHLADVEHRGLFIDFGTAAQNKYTVGDWNSGYGSRGEDGDRTFAHVGRRGRIYFQADAANDLTVSLELKPKGTGAVTPYINNEQIQSIFFEGNGWQTVRFNIPATAVKTGENYLLLTFGGVETVGGEEISVALDSVRIAKTSEMEGAFEAPEYGSYRRRVTLDGTAREAISYAAPSRFSWYVEVPEGGKLTFGVGQEGEAGGTAKVFVRAEGGSSQKLFEGRLESDWNDQILDLSSFAGKIVELRLEASGGRGKVAWAAPQIMQPEAELTDIDESRNVVVLLIDTLRASKLQTYNRDSRVRTPALTELAEHGVVFENSNSTENWTKPSTAAVLSGLYPLDHGARTQEAVMTDRVTLVSEHFKQNGFSTGAFIANGYVSDRYGFDQGWDRYINFIRDNANTDSTNVFEQAGRWAVEHKDERFFLYIHTIDPHVPYDPGDEFVSMYDPSDYSGPVQPRMTGELLVQAKANPPQITFGPADIRRLKALHDGEITQHDTQLARFIDTLKQNGLWENTSIVIVSDHGEEFQEHGSWGHGHSVYDELLHVPFIIHGPSIRARRLPTRVSTVDVAPTITELAGLPAMPGTMGRSLVPLLRGGHRAGPELSMAEFLDERQVIYAGTWKFFVRGNLTASMFNLQADPAEQNQLEVSAHPIAARYLRIMQGQFLASTDRSQWLSAEQRRGLHFAPGQVQMDGELQNQLRELGYVH